MICNCHIYFWSGYKFLFTVLSTTMVSFFVKSNFYLIFYFSSRNVIACFTIYSMTFIKKKRCVIAKSYENHEKTCARNLVFFKVVSIITRNISTMCTFIRNRRINLVIFLCTKKRIYERLSIGVNRWRDDNVTTEMKQIGGVIVRLVWVLSSARFSIEFHIFCMWRNSCGISIVPYAEY